MTWRVIAIFCVPALKKAAVREGMCSARLTQVPGRMMRGDSGTWQCSGVAFTSLNELLNIEPGIYRLPRHSHAL